MQWPWVRRSTYERHINLLAKSLEDSYRIGDQDVAHIVALKDEIQELLVRLDASADRNRQRSSMLLDRDAEIDRLRQDLVAERNAHAVTRGRVIAEAHAAGEAAPSP